MGQSSFSSSFSCQAGKRIGSVVKCTLPSKADWNPAQISLWIWVQSGFYRTSQHKVFGIIAIMMAVVAAAAAADATDAFVYIVSLVSMWYAHCSR